jgi:hypothetical protein
MARKDPGIVSEFTGLDLRRSPATSDPSSLRRATNVSLEIGQTLKTRPRLVKLCDVSSETVGLYAADGILRTVCPGGQGLQDTRPTEIWYDPIGNGTATTLGTLAKLHAWELAPASTGAKAYPYVCIETTAGRNEHHWLTETPALAATAVNTLVSLPFDPGKALVKSQSKLFADDPSAGVLRFSATNGTPRDWTAARDAGFLAVQRYSGSGDEILGLSYFKEFVAVIFKSSMQLWRMNPDPAAIQFGTALEGPGTETPRLVSNVLGDMVYFSEGGFRSLSRSLVTGDNQAEDIGAKIAALTKEETLDVEPIGLWVESRSQYIAVFGTTAYVLTYSPSTETVGWTTWELPVAIEYLVELDGSLYARAEDTVYIFDEEAAADTAGVVTYDVITAFQTMGAFRRKKAWRTVDLIQTGTSSMNFHLDPNNETTGSLTGGINSTDDTPEHGKIAINRTSNALGFRFTGTGIWELDSVSIDGTVLRGRG